MEIILVPGLWLNASTWDAVIPRLREAGHDPVPLTLPGMATRDSDRRGIGVEDHIDAVVAAIDAAAAPVLLVGHSAGCGIAHAAMDRRVDRVAAVVAVGGFPGSDGEVLLGGLPAVDGEVAMPDWAAVGEDANIVDFTPEALAAFYAGAIPAPEGVLTQPVPVRDPRRHEVPLVLVCPEYTAADLAEWIAQGALPEVAAATHRRVVDLPGGHWPQVTRPAELAEVILAAVP